MKLHKINQFINLVLKENGNSRVLTSLAAFAVGLTMLLVAGHSAPAQSQAEFEPTGALIVEAIDGDDTGAVGAALRYKVSADLLTLATCANDDDDMMTDCGINLLSVTVVWQTGQFALCATDCAADGDVENADLDGTVDQTYSIYRVISTTPDVTMGLIPPASLNGGNIRLLQLDADDPMNAQSIYDSVSLNWDTERTTLTVIILNTEAFIGCDPDTADALDSCENFALFELTLHVDDESEGETDVSAIVASVLASPVNNYGTDEIEANVVMADAVTVALETDFPGLTGENNSLQTALFLTTITITDSMSNEDDLPVRLMSLSLYDDNPDNSPVTFAVVVNGVAGELERDDTETSRLSYDFDNVVINGGEELEITFWAYRSGVADGEYADNQSYTFSTFTLTAALYSSTVPNPVAEELALTAEVIATQLAVILVNPEPGDDDPFRVTISDGTPSDITLGLAAVDASGNVDVDYLFTAADTPLPSSDADVLSAFAVAAVVTPTVSNGSSGMWTSVLTSKTDTIATAAGGMVDILSGTYWPGADQQQVAFRVSHTAEGSAAPLVGDSQMLIFNVVANRLVAVGDTEITAGENDNVTNVRQVVNAVGGAADCRTDSSVPCVVDTDYNLAMDDAAVEFTNETTSVRVTDIGITAATINNGVGAYEFSVTGEVTGDEPIVTVMLADSRSSGPLPAIISFAFGQVMLDYDFNGPGDTPDFLDALVLFRWITVGVQSFRADPSISSVVPALSQLLIDLAFEGDTQQAFDAITGKLSAVYSTADADVSSSNHPTRRFTAMDFNNSAAVDFLDALVIFRWISVGTQSYRADPSISSVVPALSQLLIDLAYEGDTQQAFGAITEKLLTEVPVD